MLEWCPRVPSIGEPIGDQRITAVFPNASQTASSIDAINGRDMTEPFTPGWCGQQSDLASPACQTANEAALLRPE